MTRYSVAFLALLGGIALVGCSSNSDADAPTKPAVPAPDNGAGAVKPDAGGAVKGNPNAGQAEMLPPPPKIGG